MTPELEGAFGSVRIPELRSVPLSDRVVELVDHPAFQRLRRVRQLGPIHLVYPGAVHTRFEHSLGVFDMARQYLRSLLRDPNVAASLTEADINACLLAGLLHDLGHYPFAHSLEAVHLPGRDTPRHEDLMGAILRGEHQGLRGEQPLARIISRRFDLDPDEVIALVSRKPHEHARPERRLVASVISSGIDADKADYLERDSVHMGVSYGRNYDRARFLDSLCPNIDGDRLAITDKGRVSAEIFIFCRYTMFSEAYWHHAVRAVSAMIELALADFQARTELPVEVLADELLSRADDELVRWLVDTSPEDSACARLLRAVSGGRRDFYRRVLTLSRAHDDQREQQAYERIYHLDAAGADALREQLRDCVERSLGAPVAIDDVIIDTPPRDKDRIETVEVVYGRGDRRRGVPLENISTVVRGIATDFVKVVKKIRVFVAPQVRDGLRDAGRMDATRELLLDTILGFHPEPHPQQRLL